MTQPVDCVADTCDFIQYRLDDARRCSNDELRDWLEKGGSRDRVVAGWVLGMRLGTEAVDLLRTHLAQESAEGVRRHLSVVLAGQQDVDTLLALSRDDPSEYVRATADRLLCGFAERDGVAQRLEEVLAEGTVREKLAVLTWFPDTLHGRLAGPLDALAAQTNPEMEVRDAAREVLGLDPIEPRPAAEADEEPASKPIGELVPWTGDGLEEH